ncbi:MAG TPA: deoxyribodipyrimidine photolyase [Planctomycetota bacterium]|nr:deoxyribodipyrimidine photolyase [Planctomycetota bacterium]
MHGFPAIRVRAVNRAPLRDGDHVLYWMTAARRTRWNFALQRAVERARELHKPLIVFEALRAGHRWASDRFHAIVLAGMAENAADCARAGVAYHAYVEPIPDAGKGLLAALAKRACVVVADDWPCFFLPRMLAAPGAHLDVALEAVDGNGLLPLRAVDTAYPTAYAFRRLLQNKLPLFLRQMPVEEPLAALAGMPMASLPPEVLARWPAPDADLLAAKPTAIARLLIDHAVAPVAEAAGPLAARQRLRDFVAEDLATYDQTKHPDDPRTSRLSAHLHWGHLSAHEVVTSVLERSGWTPDRLATKATGAKEGWWGIDAAGEAFLDQVVTWRELGFNACAHLPGYDTYDALPSWARATLEEHAGDPRTHRYTLEQFELGETHDELWNAIQRQLRGEGRIHTYLRMLWGKKVLEWTRSPREAAEVLVALNDRWAIDGRDPNSYSGIFWTLGRYDRPWAPLRPVFGSIRFMSSANTARKLHVKAYLARWAATPL